MKERVSIFRPFMQLILWLAGTGVIGYALADRVADALMRAHILTGL